MSGVNLNSIQHLLAGAGKVMEQAENLKPIKPSRGVPGLVSASAVNPDATPERNSYNQPVANPSNSTSNLPPHIAKLMKDWPIQQPDVSVTGLDQPLVNLHEDSELQEKEIDYDHYFANRRNKLQQRTTNQPSNQHVQQQSYQQPTEDIRLMVRQIVKEEVKNVLNELLLKRIQESTIASTINTLRKKGMLKG